jgi:hypothetical protein
MKLPLSLSATASVVSIPNPNCIKVITAEIIG